MAEWCTLAHQALSLWYDMRVLISGGTGYIGGKLAVSLSNAGHQIVLGSRNLLGSPTWLPDAKTVQTIWNDQAELSRICNDIDLVIHAAGMNARDCIDDPVAAMEFNGVTTARFAAAASRAGVRRFVYLSTAHVYRKPLTGLISEKTCPSNIHPYATSHLFGEKALEFQAQSGQIEVMIFRLSNVVGPPVSPEANCWDLFVNEISRQIFEEGQITIFSPPFQQRDFVAMDEVSRVIGAAVDIDTIHDGFLLMNLGSGKSTSLLSMAEKIANQYLQIFDDRIDVHRISAEGPSQGLQYDIKMLERYFGKSDLDLELEIASLLKFCQRMFAPLKK